MNGADDHYFSTPDAEEAAIKRKVMGRAKESYVLIDASKIGQKSFANVASLSSAHIITNRTSHPILPLMKEKTEVITV
ncbi:Transcriptional repressor of the fructose operon, DeoR family [Streptococcus sp. DD13]|nr:Transcriptional repressor of the fructose operon, DeoR family [Streptococcus sp. DD13]